MSSIRSKPLASSSTATASEILYGQHILTGPEQPRKVVSGATVPYFERCCSNGCGHFSCGSPDDCGSECDNICSLCKGYGTMIGVACWYCTGKGCQHCELTGELLVDLDKASPRQLDLADAKDQAKWDQLLDGVDDNLPSESAFPF